jgi:predicted SprT family Zn-dependent metalloprotease
MRRTSSLIIIKTTRRKMSTTALMTDRTPNDTMEDLTDTDWQDVKARFNALKSGKYGMLWGQILATQKTTAAPRSPATSTAFTGTERVNVNRVSTPTDMQVTVTTTKSSCRCGCTPKTGNRFLPPNMLDQENQLTVSATPVARWTPLLEDEDEEDSEDASEEEIEEAESQFHRRVLEFDSENDEEGDDEEAGDDAEEGDDDDESGDEGGDDSSASSGSTVVAFNNVSFYHSPVSGGVEHQDDSNFVGTDLNVAADANGTMNESPLGAPGSPSPESPVFAPPTQDSLSTEYAAGTFNLNESSLIEPESPAQESVIINAAAGTFNLNESSRIEPESPAQESVIINAADSSLNESSFSEPESPPRDSPAFVPSAKASEVIDLMDSSDDDRESSPVIAPRSKASQAIELISSGEEKNNESSGLIKEERKKPSSEFFEERKKKPFVDRSVRPTLHDDSSSTSSEDMEWDDNAAFKTSFSDASDSSVEQLVKRTKKFVIESDEDSFLDEDEDGDDDSVEQLVQRTNRIVIESDDNDSSTEDDSVEAVRPAKRPPRKSKDKLSKKSVSKAAFRRSRETMGIETFEIFDNAAFGGKLATALVTLTWSNKLRTTAGLTRLLKTTRPGSPPVFSASIELSSKVIDDPHRLRSTLLHEMCHAAAWMIDGVSNPPHGKCFQKWGRIAMKNVTDIEVTTTHDYVIAFKYAWGCTTPKCGVVFKRHSRSVDVDKHRCGRCKGKLIEIEVPSDSNAGAEHVPKKKAPPSAYNLFVKEHSAKVREQLEAGSSSKVPQPEVMKECARLWRENTPNKK